LSTSPLELARGWPVKAKTKKKHALEVRRDELAEKVVKLHYRRRPDLELRFGIRGRERCLEDVVFHIGFLVQAVAAQNSKIFLDYVLWAKALLVYRAIPVEDFQTNLECLLRVIRTSLPANAQRLPAAYVKDALAELPSMPTELPSFVHDNQPHARLANEYLQLLLLHDREKAGEVIRQALRDGVSISHVYQHIFTPVEREVGRLWQQNKITVAQEHYCTAATEVIMAQVSAEALGRPRKELRLLAFCIEGENHCLGLHMFCELMELNGWGVAYVGGNTPVGGVVELAKQYRPHVVAISATMVFNLPKIDGLIKALRAGPSQPKLKFLVGGRAFEQDSRAWQRYEADAFAPDLLHGMEKAESLISGS
jgi:methanogenic corrinoid protein MtbC1